MAKMSARPPEPARTSQGASSATDRDSLWGSEWLASGRGTSAPPPRALDPAYLQSLGVTADEQTQDGDLDAAGACSQESLHRREPMNGKAQDVGTLSLSLPRGQRGPFLLPQDTVGTLRPSSRQWRTSLPGGSDSLALGVHPELYFSAPRPRLSIYDPIAPVAPK